MECKRCHSQANNQVLTPEGPHYGKLVCASCGNFLTWLPRPATEMKVDYAKLPKPTPGPLPALTGASQRQIDFGARCRDQMMGRLQTSLTKELYEAMTTITDATFWIANNDKPGNLIRWPKQWT